MKNKTADIAEYNKKYYQKNKEKLQEKVVCQICGKTYAKWNTTHHFKSKQHIYIEQMKKNLVENMNTNVNANSSVNDVTNN